MNTLNKTTEMIDARKNFKKNLMLESENLKNFKLKGIKQIESHEEKIKKLTNEMLPKLSKGEDITNMQQEINITKNEILEIKKNIEKESETVEQAEINFFKPYVKGIEQEYEKFYYAKVEELRKSEDRVKERNKKYNEFIESERIKRLKFQEELNEGYLKCIGAVGGIIGRTDYSIIKNLDKQIFYNKDLKKFNV